MITRIFRVEITPALRQEFELKFKEVSIPLLQSFDGVISVTVGGPCKWSPNEYLLISTWVDEAAIIEFAGDQWNEAIIPQAMEPYVSQCWVHHFENYKST